MWRGTVILQGTSALQRTDVSFKEQRDQNHHIGVSPLLKIPSLGLVSNFPIDYMHSVCLGVTRKLLFSWTGGALNVRLRSRHVQLISERLLSLRSSIPIEFNRKPRALSELARWKASEFRTFLLYLGPIVLKDVVPIAIYEHFLLLHCAISILVSNTRISELDCKIAHELICIFLNHGVKIYGRQFYVYNVHSLCHISSDVERFGALDSYSAFPFENYLGQLKNLIKSPNNPLQQIIRRLAEINSLNKTISPSLQSIKYSVEHNDGPVPCEILIFSQFKKLTIKNCVFTVFSYRSADSYFMTKNNCIVQIHNILVTDQNSLIVGKKFSIVESFFSYPLNSEELNIYCLKNISDILEVWNVKDIALKCLASKFNNHFISFPLIHTE